MWEPVSFQFHIYFYFFEWLHDWRIQTVLYLCAIQSSSYLCSVVCCNGLRTMLKQNISSPKLNNWQAIRNLIFMRPPFSKITCFCRCFACFLCRFLWGFLMTLPCRPCFCKQLYTEEWCPDLMWEGLADTFNTDFCFLHFSKSRLPPLRETTHRALFSDPQLLIQMMILEPSYKSWQVNDCLVIP